MRSSGNGPFGVLLLTAPLVAVPLLAIFGIPQFVPGVDASPLSEHSEAGFEDGNENPRAQKSRRRSSVDDLFDPLPPDQSSDYSLAEDLPRTELEDREDALEGYRMARPGEQFADASSSELWFENQRKRENGSEGEDEIDRDEFDRTESTRGIQESRREMEDDDYDRPAGNRRSTSRDLEPVNPPRELEFEESPQNIGSDHEPERKAPRSKRTEETVVYEEFSWRQASKRLRELGNNVRHYFDYDIEKETYVFHCELSPLDDPGVVQEFQAQGHEPLTTVREVIKQVERWSKNRHSSLAKSDKHPSDRSR